MRISSIEKALKLIDFLAQGDSFSLSRVSRELGYSVSTTHHIIRTLVDYDYVVQDPETKRYAIGFKFLTVGRAILDRLDIRRIAAPHLKKLHQACQEAVHLAVLRNGRVVYIDKIDSGGGLSLATYVGFATDPHAAAGGKVMLAELSPEDVAGIFAERRRAGYGRNIIDDLDRLSEELALIRGQGFAVDDEEYYEGVRCVAAPIRAGGKIIASISITGSIFTVTRERIETELAPMVVETAGLISAELAW